MTNGTIFDIMVSFFFFERGRGKTQTAFTFARVEMKYLLSPQQHAAIREALKDELIEDEFGRHTISSDYYDTDDFTMTRHSISGPVFKEKLRVRSYPDSEKIFPEIKQKYKGIVYKRRVSCMMEEWESFRRGETAQVGQYPQIAEELKMILCRYGKLSPKVTIAYDRTAHVWRQDENVRVTFDENLSAAPIAMDGTRGEKHLLLPEGWVVMEIKIPGSVPLAFSALFSRLGVFPRGFSKVGYWYRNEVMKSC